MQTAAAIDHSSHRSGEGPGCTAVDQGRYHLLAFINQCRSTPRVCVTHSSVTMQCLTGSMRDSWITCTWSIVVTHWSITTRVTVRDESSSFVRSFVSPERPLFTVASLLILLHLRPNQRKVGLFFVKTSFVLPTNKGKTHNYQ